MTLTDTEKKLLDNFSGMVVYKDLQKSNFFNSISLPSFLRDWVIKKFQDIDGDYDINKITNFVNRNIPPAEAWVRIKDRLITDREHIKILTKISFDIKIQTGEIHFSLPKFSLGYDDTIIEQNTWENIRDEINDTTGEIWGIIELAYRSPDEFNIKFSNNKAKTGNKGKIKLVDFKSFCPYKVNLESFKNARAAFDNVEEWIDVILGAVDYNASGYDDKSQKLAMITRFLPFVEQRLNLIELAPKGTGKSYVFERVSRYGKLSGGGKTTRTKMFTDLNGHTKGLVFGNDYVAFDEVQTISFGDSKDEKAEMRAALKTYMENGNISVGSFTGESYAGVILLGNISDDNFNEFNNMFAELPSDFHESALIDRFHGFIKGWQIPRMREELKICGWALNSEYFTSIMHLLRSDSTYRAIVDEIIEPIPSADTRDTEAIKRICTAYLKLLFPHVRSVEDINYKEFTKYCLKPAKDMRNIIIYQMSLLDAMNGQTESQYAGKTVPELEVKERYRNG